MASTFILVLPDSDYSVTLNNVKGLEVCTLLDTLTNIEILRYVQNDRIVRISKGCYTAVDPHVGAW